MASIEDEDAYLYDEPQTKKLRKDQDKDVSSSKRRSISDSANNSPKHSQNENSEANIAAKSLTPALDASKDSQNGNAGEEGEYSSDEYEDDDSDIEIIIDSKPGQRVEPPQKSGPYSRVTTSSTANGALTSSSNGSAGTGTAPSTSGSVIGPDASAVESADSTVRKGIDLDAIGQWEGQEISDVSFDKFEDKPWRKPGADITDYFNYGFDEVTWAAYCSRQDNLRDFNVQKITRILGANNPMTMQIMPNMMGGYNAPPGFPNAAGGFNGGGFPDMMSMGMFPPGMGGFNMGGMGNMGGGHGGNNSGNDDGGAYGGNVQGVAGLVANPHPHFRGMNDNDQNNYNNNNNNQWNR